MSPTQDGAPTPSHRPSVQLATAAVVASYIHEISDRHRRRDDREDEVSESAD